MLLAGVQTDVVFADVSANLKRVLQWIEQAGEQGADLVVTDTWVSMHDPQSARERRHNQLRGYQVNDALMAKANADALFMHCLPARRGEEVTDEVADHARSRIFDQAENRLHTIKAVMVATLGS